MSRKAFFFCLFVILAICCFSSALAGRGTAPYTTDSTWYICYASNSYPGGNEGDSLAGNCTWYAYGRAWEILGERPNGLNNLGNAETWYQNVTAYDKGSTPEAGAIVCWSGGGYGHVAFVEEVYSDSSILISESNAYSYYPSDLYWREWTINPYTYMDRLGGSLLGYIYLPYGNRYALDVNFKVNGEDVIDVSGLASFSITVGNETYHNQTDFYKGSIKEGTSYTIYNIDCSPGCQFSSYNGMLSGSLSADCTICLNFTASYTVQYTGYGQSNVPEPQEKLWNKNITIANATLNHYDYTFAGWSTSPDDNTVDYLPGATYSANESVTLYLKADQ